jgi:hypothetical protein
MSDRRCSAGDCTRAYSSKGYCAMHAERVRRFGSTEPVGRRRKSMADRLWAKVDRSGGPDACWPFAGELTDKGYGRIRTGVEGEPTIGAHRAAFIVSNPGAERPETVDHLCHNPSECALGDECPHRRCCNPTHLAAATVAENSAPDRQWTRRGLAHCAAGHDYDQANTRWWTTPKGQTVRICRACDARRARERKAS